MTMTIPQFSLLGFAIWTLVVPLGAVGVYRWSRVLSGAERVNDFSADGTTGADWYRRAMRAHANCVENLPVFGALVVLVSLCGVDARWIDALALTVLVTRMAQSTVHMGWKESERSVGLRFTCFFIQFLSMLALGTGLLVVVGVHAVHAAY